MKKLLQQLIVSLNNKDEKSINVICDTINILGKPSDIKKMYRILEIYHH